MSDYVLIVDDDPDVRMIMHTALSLFGVPSRNASNGRQALDMVREHPPRAIILDLLMPTMSGFSTLHHLQADPVGRSIPVILVSGLVDDRQAVNLPGVVGVMRKGDFSLDDLLDMLALAGLDRKWLH